MRKRTLVAMLVLSVAVVGLGTGFTVRESAAADYHVAMIAPLTGPYVFVGGPNVQGAKAAIAEVNKAGGVNGHKLVLDVFDDGTNPGQSLAYTRQVVSDSKYIALIGSGFSSSALPDEQVTAEASMPYISMAAADAQVFPPQKGVYVVPPISRLFAYNLGQYLRKAGIKKIALFHDNSGYPTTGINNVKQFAPKYGIDIVSDQTFSLSTTDFTAQLTSLKNSSAQAIWLWNLPSAVAITKAYRQLNIPQTLVLTGGQATPQYIGPACPDDNGALINSPLAQVAKYLPKSNKARPIALHVDKLMKQQGNQFAYDGYAGVFILKKAIEMGGGTRDGILGALEGGKFSLWQAEGLYKYSDKRHAGLGIGDLVVSKIVNCKMVPLKGEIPQPKPKKKK